MSELAHLIIDEADGEGRLHKAAYEGDALRLREYLGESDLQYEVDRRIRPYGVTALRVAAGRGHVSCVQCLIEHKASIDLADVKAQTPLFVAIKNHHIKCARILLEAGANPDGDSGNRSTPLYIAAIDGFLEGIKLLLEFGAETELEERLLGCVPGLPLHTAAIYHHFECYASLLLGGAELDLRSIKPPLPANVIAQLSLPHAIVRHQCPLKFAQLLIEFGGYIWQKDTRGRLATEHPLDGESKQFFIETLGNPLSLCSLCRISIRRHLGRYNLHLIFNLPLPKKLIDFLCYSDFLPRYQELLS